MSRQDSMKTILLITAILALMVGACSAQTIIQTQQGGMTNGTFKRYFVLNCVSGLTCSVSGSTLNMIGAGITAPFYITQATAASTVALSANKVLLNGFLLPAQVTFTQLTYRVVGADNTANLYDLGIYNSGGTLICDFGAIPGTTFAPSVTTNMTLPCTQGTVIAPAGKYYVGMTAVTATATLGGSATAWTFLANNSLTTAGAALGGTITPPADSWQTSTVVSVTLR